jgi:hypothetical protein
MALFNAESKVRAWQRRGHVFPSVWQLCATQVIQQAVDTTCLPCFPGHADGQALVDCFRCWAYWLISSNAILHFPESFVPHFSFVLADPQTN